MLNFKFDKSVKLIKKDIFLIILWLIFGLAGVYFVTLTLYVATCLNIETNIAPYNSWRCDEAFFSFIGGILCIYASVQCREWYFDNDTNDDNDDDEIIL